MHHHKMRRPCCLKTITFSIQIESTEAHLLYIIDVLIKNKARMNITWFGPTMASVGCWRPETIKLVLKGQWKV